MVKIPRAGAETDPGKGRHAEPGQQRDVDEAAATLVVVQSVVVILEVGDQQVGLQVAVIVSPGHTHPGLRPSPASVSQTGLQGGVGEVAAVVAKQEVGCRVVGHEEVHVAVVVDVYEQGRQAIAGIDAADAGGLGLIDEATVVVAQQGVRRRRQPDGTDKHARAPPPGAQRLQSIGGELGIT